MVLTSTGEVLTNNHVIDGATSIKVTDIGNGRTYTAKVVGYDQTKDVAVLQLVGASGLKTVTLSSSSPQAGQKVVALGNAGGKGGTPSVATGTVTGLGQSITASDESSGQAEQLTGLVQTNADIQPGDSGGPLVNTYGQVVGMDTAASSSPSTTGFQSPTGQTQTQTQAFAIPISEASSIASAIEAGTSSSTTHLGATAFLGVEVSSSAAVGGYGNGYGGSGGSSASGVVVAGVVSGSAAGQAGLAAGDEITSVAGHAITSSSDIQSVLGNYHPGDKISISWTDQSGQSQTATVVLTTGPAG
jgi:S1-C subfamily serine protease